jgi:transcription termination factor Rho
LRRALSGGQEQRQNLQQLLNQLRNTRTNHEFLRHLNQSVGG